MNAPQITKLSLLHLPFITDDSYEVLVNLKNFDKTKHRVIVQVNMKNYEPDGNTVIIKIPKSPELATANNLLRIKAFVYDFANDKVVESKLQEFVQKPTAAQLATSPAARIFGTINQIAITSYVPNDELLSTSPLILRKYNKKSNDEYLTDAEILKLSNNKIHQTRIKLLLNSANGYYYDYDGNYFGKYGTSDEVVVCDKMIIKYRDKNDKVGWLEFDNPNRLVIINSEFIHFAGAIYAESVQGYGIFIKNEIFAFATCIGNFILEYKEKNRMEITYREALNSNGVYGVGTDTYTNFIDSTDRNKNDSMKCCLASVINQVFVKADRIDYSNGAIYWDGIDIKTAKWADGLKFANKTHDIFGIGDNKNSGKEFWLDKNKKKTKYLRKKWDYIYETTAAFSGDNTKKINPHYPYFKGDKQNKNKFGTTFIKEHPDFNKVIPNKTQKDDEK